MIDRLEKIQWIASGVVVAIFVGMFFYPGLPEAVPDIPPPVAAISVEEFVKGMSKEENDEFQRNSQRNSARIKTGPKAQEPAKPLYRKVPTPVYTVLSEKREAVAQMKKVAADIDTRQKTVTIRQIDPDSYLHTLGIEVGDKVEFVDGNQLPLDDVDALWALYDEKLPLIKAGKPISVTVDRKGRRYNLIFRLADVEGALK